MVEKKETRGGARKGAGMKPGSKKTKLKPEEKKRTIRKLYQWTSEEYTRIQEAVKVSGKKESKIVQEGTLRLTEEILTETTNR